LTSPSIGANLWASAKRGVTNALTGKGFKKSGVKGIVGGLGVGTLGFIAPDVAQAYMDAPVKDHGKAKATANQALESGFEVGTGLALFTGAVKSAQWLVPAAAPAIGVAASVAGTAIVGGIAGSAAADVRTRVRRVREKNKRDAAQAQAKYGTPELARRTRLGLDPKTGKPPTLDDAGAIMDRWEREEKKLNKRRGAKE
jgi:hypothetical protein